MRAPSDPRKLLETLELKEYEVTALEHLLQLGRTTAPNLAEATGIPKARIYGVLDSLADEGFIKIIPGRPKQYQPKEPAQILSRAQENYRQQFESKRQELEEIRSEFISTFQPQFDESSENVTPTEELFWVIDVGKPSQAETRKLYRDADDQISVLTKSFEYFNEVEPAVEDALDREIKLNVLFLHPSRLSESNEQIQRDRVQYITDQYSSISLRFSSEKLPWRGTVVDPSMGYTSGKAIFLVEEKDVPLHMRQAAVTDNGSFVAGLKRYFDLIWEYESVSLSSLDDGFRA